MLLVGRFAGSTKYKKKIIQRCVFIFCGEEVNLVDLLCICITHIGKKYNNVVYYLNLGLFIGCIIYCRRMMGRTFDDEQTSAYANC